MGNLCQEQKNKSSSINYGDFYLKNIYPPSKRQNQDVEELAAMLDPSHSIVHKQRQYFHQLCHYILNQGEKPFKDPNFTDFSNCTVSLSSLYDYEHLEKTNIYRKEETKSDFFQQHELQFTYLTTVFYELCRNKEIQERILVTKDINNYQTFLFRLFCNGEETLVAVDGQIPIQQNSEEPQYVSVSKGNEIWIPLLEKAWCKQVGSFQKAKGLSPEDAFEEITGVPAYSYPLKKMKRSELQKFLDNSIERNFWVSFVAEVNLAHFEGLESRQVFHLQGKKKGRYLIRSPYLNYELNGHKQNENTAILVHSAEILDYFQFMTVGYVMKNATLKFQELSTEKREEKIYKLKVTDEDLVNIRFVQFFEEYLKIEEKVFYEYSPVLMELYDQEYNLLYEGCPKSTTGSRSSHLSNHVLIPLTVGTYYLRIEVDWRIERVLNKGNIVIYSKYTEIQEKISNLPQTIKLMNQSVVLNHESEQIPNTLQQLKMQISEKTYGYVVCLRNESRKPTKIVIDFSKSKNIRIKGEQLRKMKLSTVIKGESSCFLEVVAENRWKAYELCSFQISQLKGSRI